MITVRTRLPESAAASQSVRADLDVEFAGQTAHYTDVEFQLSKNGNEIRIIGTIPCKLTDFKIDPPSLLTVPIKNDIPVKVDMSWRRQ